MSEETQEEVQEEVQEDAVELTFVDQANDLAEIIEKNSREYTPKNENPDHRLVALGIALQSFEAYYGKLTDAERAQVDYPVLAKGLTREKLMDHTYSAGIGDVDSHRTLWGALVSELSAKLSR